MVMAMGKLEGTIMFVVLQVIGWEWKEIDRIASTRRGIVCPYKLIKYSHDDEALEDQEETGWKHIHGGGFLFQNHKPLLLLLLQLLTLLQLEKILEVEEIIQEQHYQGLKYLKSSSMPQHLDIHWFFIINSCVAVILLSGVFTTILMRVLLNDFIKYSHDDEPLEDQEETGWKHIHGYKMSK